MSSRSASRWSTLQCRGDRLHLEPKDILTPEARSRAMGRMRGRATMPEIAGRTAATRLGYRYRQHRRDLTGAPDLGFPRLKTVVLLHGCFGYRHAGCKYSYRPKSNVWS